MAKKKKASGKGKSPETCPECGGPKKGRGYAHSAKCSKADPRTRKSKSGEGKPKRTRKPKQTETVTASAEVRPVVFGNQRLADFTMQGLAQLRDLVDEEMLRRLRR